MRYSICIHNMTIWHICYIYIYLSLSFGPRSTTSTEYFSMCFCCLVKRTQTNPWPDPHNDGRTRLFFLQELPNLVPNSCDLLLNIGCPNIWLLIISHFFPTSLFWNIFIEVHVLNLTWNPRIGFWIFEADFPVAHDVFWDTILDFGAVALSPHVWCNLTHADAPRLHLPRSPCMLCWPCRSPFMPALKPNSRKFASLPEVERNYECMDLNLNACSWDIWIDYQTVWYDASVYLKDW
jgi:hypothetical protein